MLYREDEKLARQLQDEENEMVARGDELLAQDAEFAASLSEGDSLKSGQKDNVPDLTPQQIHNPKYRPGEWGT